MDAAVGIIMNWTLQREIQIPREVQALLTQGEQPWASYATMRDSATFTNKRLIIRDAQGISGKKVETYSLPYREIIMWSSENAGGLLDFNSELELWTRAGHIKVKLNKGVDVRKIDAMLSQAILSLPIQQ